MSQHALKIVEILEKSFWPLVKAGITVTLPLASISFIIGLVIALAVALMRLSKSKTLQNSAMVYMTVVRGIPIIVLLFIVYFGLPYIGIVFNPFVSSIICLAASEGAYDSEVFRSSILAISKGQIEACKSLGMNGWQTFRYVVFPQASLIAVPPLANSFIGITKTTSLTAVLTVTEIFHIGYKLTAVYYEPLWIYVEIGAIYLVMISALMIAQHGLETKLGRHLKELGI